MAKKERCPEAGCGSPLFNGVCPTPELHNLDDSVKLSSQQRLTDLLDMERAKQEKTAQVAELKKHTALENRTRRYIEELHEQLVPYEPIPFVFIPPIDHRPTHEHVVLLSDWHIGQKTRIEETGSMFYQDTAVTTKQVTALAQANAVLYDLESASRNIKKLNILAIGDLVDGDDMRNSQHNKTTELLAPQTIRAARLLGWYAREALGRYEEVDIEVVGGNHDRLSRKPGDAGLGELGYEDSAAWLIGEMLKMQFKDEPRIHITNWSAFFGVKIIVGMKVVFEHGCSFRWGTGGYGGIPFYAITNAGRQYESMLDGADLITMGHGHMPIILPIGFGSSLVMNGSLPPSSTYVQSSFKAVRRPLQTLLSVHHEMGLTGYMRLYADHDGIKQPGEVWSDIDEIRKQQDMDWGDIG